MQGFQTEETFSAVTSIFVVSLKLACVEGVTMKCIREYGLPPSGETVETVEYSGEKVATERLLPR